MVKFVKISTMQRYSILWADDEIDLLKPHIIFLEQRGYDITPVNNGSEAVEKSDERHFDVVFLDENMPGMSGLEVCRRIRASPGTRQIPIMMISALGGEENRITGIEMGADDYLAKPFSPREVVSRVGSLLRRTRRLLDEGPATGDEALSIEEHCLKITMLGRQLTVSQPEWRLLQLLSKRSGQIVSVEELASLIWSDSEFLRHRDLDAIMATLNIKVRNASSGSIEVVPTIGYRLVPPRATA